jgi:O-antigen/teichoic acid export membrane protein
VIANAFRAGVVFLTGIIVARGLSPAGYGNLTFMLGSFVSIRTLLDMGTSGAFYTFLSKRPRCARFYLFYLLWLLLQFAVTLLLVLILIPNEIFQKIWLGNFRETVALAFVASFMQQQIWQMVGQIGESSRKTIQVQFLNVAVACVYLACISLLTLYGAITIQKVMVITVILYGVSSIVGYRLLVVHNLQLNDDVVTVKGLISDYRAYCQPMLGLAVAGFLYTFIDKWMLQKFGGAVQQGYFQIAAQFAQISLLATISILNIFWKEIAEATAKQDHARVQSLYLKINRGLVILSAIFAGLLLPWSRQIVSIFLGQNYIEAWVVVAIMFLYPIHQSMGQIGGAMFMAGGDTRKYMILSISMMLFTLPLSYFAMAPSEGVLLPGLGLGAIGMVSYMVISSIFSVNIQAWVIARHHGWKFDWVYQVVGIPMILLLGYVGKFVVGFIWNLELVQVHNLIAPVLFSCILYGALVFIMIWTFPWLAGIERIDIKRLIGHWSLSGRRNEIN